MRKLGLVVLLSMVFLGGAAPQPWEKVEHFVVREGVLQIPVVEYPNVREIWVGEGFQQIRLYRGPNGFYQTECRMKDGHFLMLAELVSLN